MSLQIQFLTLSLMAGSGALLGVLFDLYRVLSGQLRVPRLLVPLLDAVYWAAAALLVFRVLLYSNYGQVRFYVFLGLAFGTWAYFRVASRPFVRFVLFCIRIVKAVIRWFGRMIELLIVKPIKLLYRLAIVVIGFFAALSIFLFKVVLQLLYPFRLLFRAIGRPIRKRLKAPVWWSRFAGRCRTWIQALTRLFRNRR